MAMDVFEKWSGAYCTIDEVASYAMAQDSRISRKTVIWRVNELVKQGKIIRAGRGVYFLAPKKRFQLDTGETTKRICSILAEKMPYLEVTITDTSILGELMNLQPFSSAICLEVKKTAVNAALSVLRKEGISAYAKKDYSKIERYITTNQPILVKPELAVNPKLAKEKNVRYANIEKMLVDLICDEDIYGQYQDSELHNIYRNATERYAVNYSQMLKYAAARGRKAQVIESLQETNEFQKVRSML